MNLEVTRLSGPDVFDVLAREWDELDARTEPRAPFTSPLWNSLWWKHFRKQNLMVCDDLMVHAVRSTDGKLVAVAPLFKRCCPARGPLRWRFVQFFGADASITELRGLICAPEHQDDARAALEAYFQRVHRDWDVFRWDGVRGRDSDLAHSHTGSLVGAPGRYPNYFIPLPETWEKLHARVTSNFRRNMRKQRENFERDGLSYTFKVFDHPESINRPFEKLLNLHGERANFEDMDVKHPDRFAKPVNRRFLTEYVNAMAQRGHVRLFELEISGRTIASQLTFVVGRDLWFYTSGFDPALRNYGVMTMLQVEIMRWAIAGGYAAVNLSCGQDRGKSRWRPCEIEYSYFLLRAPGVRARMAMKTYGTLEAARLALAQRRGYRLGAVKT